MTSTRPQPLHRDTLRRYAGGWAVVTGAARAPGLGYAFARQIAVEGLNLVLVDILADELERRAAELRAEFGVQVRVAVCDLGDAGPWAEFDRAITDVDIDLLVCNHMYTPTDTPMILDMELDVHHRMLDINARAYTTLIHTVGNRMRHRNRGSIVIVSSGAGLTSAPFTGAYSANKAFQIALGEALWFELGRTHVDVLVVIGGLMRTQGDALDAYPKFLIAEPAPVVREVLQAIGRKHLVIPGAANRAMTLLQTRLSSRRRAVQSIGRFMARGLGK
jgi:uncharacterized protein